MNTEEKTCTIHFDPTVRFQTIEGWGGRIGPKLNPSEPLEQILREAVMDLGATRFGLELAPWAIEPVNDNSDPYVLNAAALDFSSVDQFAKEVALPLRTLVTGRGDRFVLYVTVPWITPAFLRDPEEYAELCIAVLQRFRQLGVEVDYWAIKNEPDFVAGLSPAMLGRFIVHVGGRLRAAGFQTRFAVPEAVIPRNVAPWLGGVVNTPGALQYLGQITYHSYDYDPTNGETPPAIPRVSVAQWAQRLGLNVAQTEQGAAGKRNVQRWDGVQIEHGLDLAEDLWADLTFANASAWEPHVVFTRAEDGGKWVGSGFLHIAADSSTLEKPVHYWTLRQFTRYVRPGAIRVGISVSAGCADIRAVGFVSPQGRPVIVAMNLGPSPCRVQIASLLPGNYRFTLTAQGKNGEEQPPVQLGPGADLHLTLPGKSIVTIWQPSGPSGLLVHRLGQTAISDFPSIAEFGFTPR